jgi:hypothetical protein
MLAQVRTSTLVQRVLVCLCLLSAASSCSRPASSSSHKRSLDGGTPAPAPATAAAPALAVRLEDAQVEASASAARGRATQGVKLRSVKPPKHGCAVRYQQTLPGALSRGIALYMEAEPVVLGLARDGRELSLFRVGAGAAFERAAQRALPAAAQRVSAICGGHCQIALVDERAQLVALELEGARFSEPRVLAKGVDRRFAPALARQGKRTLFAYTSSVDEAMHTLLITIADGKVGAARDLTPAGHGAAAPTFVLGSAPPTLLFIDARAGFSPLLEVPFDAAGEPGVPIVRTPVSQPYAPPLLSAVQWGRGEVEVFFTAIGRAAMTAVGRVWLRKASEARALLPSKGYGERELTVGRAEAFSLFAIETVGQDEKSRTIALELSDGTTTHDLPWFDERASARPSLASGSGQGEFMAVYSRANELVVALLSCAQ